MTAREFVELPIMLKRRLEKQEEQLEKLESSAYRTTQSWQEIVSSSLDPHRREDIYAALADKHTEHQYTWQDYLTIKQDVINTIQAIPDEYVDQRSILCRLYVFGQPWRDVASIFGIKKAEVIALADEGLNMIEVPEKYKAI